MNNSLIQKEFVQLSELPGCKISCLSPQSYRVTLSLNDQSITLDFFIPTKYPSVSPLCTVSDSTNISNTIDIQSRIDEICNFIKYDSGLFLLIVQEVSSIIWTPVDSNSEEVRFPDSIETSRLTIETNLNRSFGDEWIKNRAHTFLSHPSIEQIKRTRDYLLIYCFFRACKGDFSLEECANILINEFKVIEAPCPPLALIPSVISKFLDECNTLPDYLQELFQTTESDSISRTMSFFNDFNVISLCAPSVVRARNRVDKHVYAIKIIHLRQKTSTLPPDIAQITQLQHRYIVRYYNSWISDCDENESKAISDAFCLSPPIKGPASFLFMQMDYIPGRPLSEMLHNPHFFEHSGLQWRITQQILEALHYIHSHNFVHNSMTPTNIIIDGENAKIGDFSDRTKRLSFPYSDNRPVSDKKSDMFAFGVVFFEMWHPFRSDSERKQILQKLVEKGEVPEQWKSVFPLQAKIVTLLMQPAVNRPNAIELLPLIPTTVVENEELPDVSQLAKAISAGNVRLKTNAPEVLESLFMESRRLQFRLKDFKNPFYERIAEYDNLLNEENNINSLSSKIDSNGAILTKSSNKLSGTSSNTNINSASSVGSYIPLEDNINQVNLIGRYNQIIRSFESMATMNFFKLAQSFGALYYESNFLQPLKDNDDSSVVVMSNDGALHELQMRISKSYKQMIERLHVTSLRTYTRISKIFEPKRTVDRIYEDPLLSFDIVNDQFFMKSYTDSLQFIILFIKTTFGPLLNNVLPTIKVLQTGISSWLEKRLASSRQPLKHQYHKNLAVDWSTFDRLIHQSSKENIEPIKDSLKELYELKEFVNNINDKEWPIVISPYRPPREVGSSFYLIINISKTVIAYSRTDICKVNDKSLFITSTRVMLSNILSLFGHFDIFRAVLFANNSVTTPNDPTLHFRNKPKVSIVMVCQPFLPKTPINEINRECYQAKEWNRSYVQIFSLVRLLRQNDIAVSLAPNDGESVDFYIQNMTSSFSPLLIVAYVDERNKITLRFSKTSELSKTIENLLSVDSNLKKRIIIQDFGHKKKNT